MSEPPSDKKKKRRSIVKKGEVPEPYRKHGHKGKKCLRGFGVHYDQKKQHINATLTPDALAQVARLAEKWACSRSEVLERLVRETMPPTRMTDISS